MILESFARTPHNLAGSDKLEYLHTEKYFRNLIKSTRNRIVGTYHFPIDLEPSGRPFGYNSSKNGKYNPISG